MVVLPPMTSATSRMAVALRPGACRRMRAPNRRSCGELLERETAPDAARRVGDQRNVAELAHRREPRVLGRLAALDAVADRHLEVSGDLFVDLTAASARTEAVQPAHGYASLSRGFESAAIASTNCVHRDCSLASCFRPAAVSR